MKKFFLFSILVPSALWITSCKKNSAVQVNNFDTLKVQVINDFATNTGLATYASLSFKANALNEAAVALDANTDEQHLEAAKDAWRALRHVWEQSEGFLFGPVEDNNYDPETDTWPVNFNDLDSLLASSNPLMLADIQALSQQSLKGYHPLEYILWGKSGSRAALTITAREKRYMLSLAQQLKLVATELYASWNPSEGNFLDQITTAGKGSTVFATKQSLFLVIAEAMSGICDEVAEGKMKEPFIAGDSNLVESPFSGNSVFDFIDNITGAQTVYLGTSGLGLSALVKEKNISLDNEIRQKFTNAIHAFSAITLPYEQAIISQRTQCQQVMDAVNALSETIETKLKPFLQQQITD